MNRRTSTFGVLALVAVLLCLSLGAALARPAPSSLLTATALPLFDRMAYMPRLMRSDAPPPTSTATPTSGSPTASATATATATATSTATAGRCVDYVYPLTLHKAYLDNNPPAWYKPVTLASVGLSATAEDSQIPGLNSTVSNSPRFRIYRNPNTVGLPANYSWARWNGHEIQGSQQQLADALTGAGTLGQGFHEFPPPPEDPGALPLLNGSLEVGDWLATDTGNVSSIDIVAALDSHIGNKTRMILPIHDRFFGQGNSNDSSYHVERFVEVRLLRYNLSPTGWFELALIQDNKTCGPTPPTATSTATRTAAPTSTWSPAATSTSTATSTATPTSTATAQPTATATATASATAISTSTAGRCVDYVYPITFHKIYMEQNLPAWYKPVTLASVGLGADAENAQIPSLNSTNNNSPRFRIYRNPNTVGIPGNYSWARWNGNQQSGSAAQLAAAMTGAGSLGQGFSEAMPPAEDFVALALMNGRLEVGDWLAGDSAATISGDMTAALNAHIVNKTRMILPIHDRYYGQGNSNWTGYHVERFIEVRLLSYDLSLNGYFELALIQDNKTCGPTPPTATSTAAPTATATSTATAQPTATATATQAAGGHQLSLSVTEQLQWYNPAEPGGSYDIVIVQDYSYSMRFCWDTNQVCTTPNRRIDFAAGVLRGFVNEMLVVRNQQQGGENRLAYVTFGQSATQRIPFINDTTASLAAFKAQIGDQATPKEIPNADLNGNTNIAGGLVGGVSYLNSARTVDSHGKPVKLALLLLTDGLANVFNDGGYAGVTNRWDQAPFYCGIGPEDTENPLVQFNCPSAEEFPNISPRPLPPLKAMVKVANDVRAAKPITFYAVVLGQQNGLTPVDMHLNEVAPDNYYMANNVYELEALINAIEQELGEPCYELTASPSVAAGATVTISVQGGGTVGTFSTNAQGALVLPNLSPGTYTLAIQHNGVVASQDPLMIPRNYTRMIIDGNPTPQSSITFTMPNTAFSLPPVKLVIDNPANAQCPN
jgi:hypothetical protein